MKDRTPEAPPEWIFWDGDRPAPAGWASAGPATADGLMVDGLPWTTASVTAAYVGPALSRLALWQVPFALEEFRRVLRPDGWLRVRVVDLDAVVRAYLTDDSSLLWSDDWRHRSGALAELLSDWGAARSVFTGPLLLELLDQAGFSAVSGRAADGSDSAVERLPAPDRDAALSCCAEGRRPTDPPTSSAGAGPSQVHLSWADQQGSELAITWCGPPAEEAAVRLRPSGTVAWRTWPATGRPTVDGDQAPRVFRAVGGRAELRPGTCYEFEVVHPSGGRTYVTPRSSFTTPPNGRDAVVTFAFVADTGIAGRADGRCDGARRTVVEIAALAPDFVLVGGDLAYRSTDPRLRTPGEGVRAWLDQMAPIATRRPLMVQYGNHETELAERFRDWAAHLTQPDGIDGGRCYSFAAGACHIVGFFAPTDTVEPAAVAWLEADLAAARSRGARWLIVFQHQPLFAHGSAHPASARLRVAMGPTLERHHVDLHLSAHDQNLERTYPLREVATTCPAVASTSVDAYTQNDGVVYAKVGPGGKRSDRGGDFSRLSRPLPPFVAVGDDARHHFAFVRAGPSHMEVQIHGFTSPDAPLELVDRFTITAADSRSVPMTDPSGGP